MLPELPWLSSFTVDFYSPYLILVLLVSSMHAELHTVSNKEWIETGRQAVHNII
jgi:hypothetical protein